MSRTRAIEELNNQNEVTAKLKVGTTLDALVTAVNFLLRLSKNDVLSAGGVAKATNNTGVKLVNTLTFTINGAFKSKVAADPCWTLTGGNLAVGCYRRYALLVDGSGTATVVASTDGLTAAGATFDPTAFPASTAVVAVLLIQNGSAGAFIPGTTSLSAAGITATYTDGIDPSMLPGEATPLNLP